MARGCRKKERRGHIFCRYADDCNIYVQSQRAGERVLESMTRFLDRNLGLKVSKDKSAVDRPLKCKFLGYSMTAHLKPRQKVAPQSVKRLKDKLREKFRRGRGRNIGRFIEELTPLLRGWGNYFRLAQVKTTFEELDGWKRRKLRNNIWRQWERTYAHAKNLMKFGLNEERAWASATNERGPWWNSGAAHMNQALPRKHFDALGLISLLDQLLQIQCST